MRGILTFFALLGLINGVLFPNYGAFNRILKKIKTQTCNVPLELEEAGEEGEKNNSKNGNPLLEDMIIPYSFIISFFNLSVFIYSHLEYGLSDHFPETISPPPEFK